MRTSFICRTNQISATTDSLTDGGDSLWECQCKQVLHMLCSVTVYWKHIMLFFSTKIKLWIVFQKKNWSVYTHFNVAIFSVFFWCLLMSMYTKNDKCSWLTRQMTAWLFQAAIKNTYSQWVVGWVVLIILGCLRVVEFFLLQIVNMQSGGLSHACLIFMR